MAELKRTFSNAKMNKDLDERVVPSGDYRDATNIEIATSEGSNVGAAQVLMGNTIRNTMFTGSEYNIPTTATVVGSIASAAKDKIYYFVSAGDLNNASGSPAIQKDYIVEYNTVTERHRYVFVDIYKVSTTYNGASATGQTLSYVVDPSSSPSTTVNRTGIRRGMIVTNSSYDENDTIFVRDIYYDGGWKVVLSEYMTVTNGVELVFSAPRVLNFKKNNLITGVNVLDDFLFWTDNLFEPKKINIPRSIAGTGGTEHLSGAGVVAYASVPTADTSNTFTGDTDLFHTRLTKDKPTVGSLEDVSYDIATFPDNKRAVWVDESHITVIKKAPTQPLELSMSRTSDERQTAAGIATNVSTTWDFNLFAYNVGDTITGVTFNEAVDFRETDVLILSEEDPQVDVGIYEDYDIRVEVVASDVTNSNGISSTGFSLKILSLAASLEDTSIGWRVRLEDKDSLFEFKFPRFSYRYKYIDGEYSSFAPWSQVAFLPSEYEFHPKHGYNLGMVNALKSLKLKYYHYDEYVIPDDVIEIDLLYKETNNPTVYTVKTLKRTDNDPAWPDLIDGDGGKRGEYKVTTDMIHAVVASNQLLRPYDNVPRQALAQEISANRLIYGNYLQNRTIFKDPIIQVSLESDSVSGIDAGFAVPSVKTQRTYQVGVVYSDKYGRETPVLTSEGATITVGKSVCDKRNRISAKLGMGTEVPAWAKYYTWYIKETSVEYYTLAMDRWYDAHDGNIWISFPSSDRNKVDEETFLELKQSHGTEQAVRAKARYKILAIEGEAPDYIKTERQILGTVLNTGNDKLGNQTEGYPLQDTTFITVQADVFTSTFGDDVDALNNFDSLTLRLAQGNNSSFEYSVTNVISGDDFWTINVATKFKEDALFVSTNDTWAGRVDGVTLSLFSGEVKNKPEFDGRFFCKIFRDALLVANLQNQDEELVIDRSEGLRYIHNGGYANQAIGQETPINAICRPAGSTNADSWHKIGDNSADPVAAEDAGRHPTEYNYPWFEDNYGASGSISAGDVDFASEDAFWWADGGDASSTNNVFNLKCFRFKKPVNALNCINDSRDFWEGVQEKECFFIDGATSFSLTSKKGDSGYVLDRKDRPGNTFNGGIHPATGDWSALNQNNLPGMTGPGGHPADRPEGSPAIGGYSQDDQTGNSSMKLHNGQPSRGVWNGGRCMDISWSGFSPSYTGGNWNSGVDAGGFPHLLENCDGDRRKEAAQFMRDLVTPGAKFRFQRDPDETVYTVQSFAGHTHGYNNDNYWESFANIHTGAFGIRNTNWSPDLDFTPSADKDKFRGWQIRQRWTIMVDPPIGSGPSGYDPTRGTNPWAVNDKDDNRFRRALRHDFKGQDVIELMVPYTRLTGHSDFTNNPAIWETVPKESVDIDIYYQASGLIPLTLTEDTKEEYVPNGTTFVNDGTTHTVTGVATDNWGMGEFLMAIGARYIVTPALTSSIAAGTEITFSKRKYYDFTAKVAETSSSTLIRIAGTVGTMAQNHKLFRQTHILDWNNCWTFGNGVESDRIRDDYNAPQMDNGVKASTVLAEQVKEERRKHGIIWSGIYNSNSGINETNQFIAAESITKDLNPVHGSIQKLLNRETQLIMFCEDRILRAVTNKDALYSAAGNPQLIASNAVVGDATPYQGEFGVSTNPESVAFTPYHVYFSDAARGAVCSLSSEGIVSISDKGMADYFADTFTPEVWQSIGMYDERKDEYNLTIKKKYLGWFNHQIEPTESLTVTYSRPAKGWACFKSFIPETGVSLNNHFYTFYNGQIWKHHTNTTRNNFYGTQYQSDITLLFNDNPGAVKSFNLLNYEGSQAKITEWDTVSADYWLTGASSTNDGVTTQSVTDDEYFNLNAVNGWYVDNVTTNLQSCGNLEFKNKEGKWFTYPTGDTTALTNLDEKEFSVQGIGMATMTMAGSSDDNPTAITMTVENNVSTTYTGNEGGSTIWDSTPD
jgi:hypothetical protein